MFGKGNGKNSLLFEVKNLMLSKEEAAKIQKYTEKAVAKYNLEPKQAENLKTLYTSTVKHYKIMKEALSGIKQADIQEFRDIALVATTKAYVGNILEYVASVQPISNPFDYIYTVEWKYADDYAAEKIKAGDSLKDKRTKSYGRVGEEEKPRKLKSVITRTPIDAVVRSIEMSETLQAVLSLKSVFGEEGSQNFLNNTYLDVVASKLKDEMELTLIDAIENAVPAENVVAFSKTSPDATDCINARCHAQRLFEAIEEAANRVFNKTSVRPNTLIVGSEALSIMRKGDMNIVRYNKDGAPIGTARNYIGVLEDAFNIVYEPTVSGVLLTYKHPTNTVESAVVYAPHVPLGITPTIQDRDLSVYRVVYTIDAIKVVHPELLAKVDIV